MKAIPLGGSQQSASFLVRPAEGTESPSARRGQRVDARLHSWYDPLRVLKDCTTRGSGLAFPASFLVRPAEGTESLVDGLGSIVGLGASFLVRPAEGTESASASWLLFSTLPRFIPGTTR